MSNTLNSTNMNMPIPVVGVDPGPDYALNINSCLTTIDGHNHAPGFGVSITPSGLNISSDLSFIGNSAIDLKSTVFTAQTSFATVKSLYVIANDLYFNDGNSNVVRITQSGGVSGSAGNITGLASPATAVYSAPTFTWQSDANIPANMDMGGLILRNILVNSKGITITPPNALAANYSLTLPTGLPAATNFMSISSSGAIAAYAAVAGGLTGSNLASATITNSNMAANSVDTTQLVDSSVTTGKIDTAAVTNAKMASNSVDTSQLVALSVTAAKLADLNYNGASPSGTYTESTSTPSLVTNQTINITVGHRPIMVVVRPTAGASGRFEATGSTAAGIKIIIKRDGSSIYDCNYSAGTGTIELPCSAVNVLDTTVTAGVSTYTLFIACTGTGTPNAKAVNLQIIAYEV